MKKEEQNEMQEEATYSFMQRVLCLFVFPFLFLTILILGYLTYEGKNVFDIAQTFLPEKAEVTVTDEDKEKTNTPNQGTENTPKPSQQVVLLERELNAKQREVTKLVAELEQANKRIRDLEEQEKEVKASTKELANLYERMSTKKAAQILMELDEDLAILILSELSTSKTSSILAQLEPEQAARFTKMLARNG